MTADAHVELAAKSGNDIGESGNDIEFAAESGNDIGESGFTRLVRVFRRRIT
jgi:hypothetical protein